MTWLPLLSFAALVYCADNVSTAPPVPTGVPRASSRHEATRIRSTHSSTAIIRWVGGYQDPQLYDESVSWQEDQDAKTRKRKENQEKAAEARAKREDAAKIKAAKAQYTRDAEAKRRQSSEALAKTRAAEARESLEKAAKERVLAEKLNKLSKSKPK